MTRNYFRSAALDYDGTLTTEQRPTASLLTTLQEARRGGIKLVLVTGRILSELRADFADVEEYFDAIVGENGAVLKLPESAAQTLAPAVPTELMRRLNARGVSIRRGEVLLAGKASDEMAIVEEIRGLGLDCQVLVNRTELMVLPAGVSKGTGSLYAHAELGVSFHNCVAFGDAENDHSLLDHCEVSVAVHNAIPSLKAHADIVLDLANGEGVGRFFEQQLIPRTLPAASSRWYLDFGTDTKGASVRIPAAGINVLIAGASGTGKSYLAGLLAERLVERGYSFLLIDPEGDHQRLGQLRGVIALGGRDALPPVAEILDLLRHRFGSVVIDLSLTPEEEGSKFARRVLEAAHRLRESCGLPHWLILEEAHELGDVRSPLMQDFLEQGGLCRVTYVPGPMEDERAHSVVLRTKSDGQFMFVDGDHGRPRLIVPGVRATPHVRHLHKYTEAQVAPESSFVFRNEAGPTGRTARNMWEFVQGLRVADASVLAHHVANADFSRWTQNVFHNSVLARQLESVEQLAASGQVTVEEQRRRLIDLVERAYRKAPPAALRAER